MPDGLIEVTWTPPATELQTITDVVYGISTTLVVERLLLAPKNGESVSRDGTKVKAVLGKPIAKYLKKVLTFRRISFEEKEV